ncbi:formyltransferase family protein [Salidesulfovibrio brasiliensis]|uniref:formyltransferase family protein n=1 Tax=Salidesulfovibrio brasiliensis TaxID=221711 RepID=UPI0006D13537|nr:formyltransferase family protein [Salidesulfovibrio brasiliensis]
MRAVFVGCVEFSRKTLEWLAVQGPGMGLEIAGVVTRAASPFNADFADLGGVCREHGIPVRLTDDINAVEDRQWIADRDPDVLFVFGWSSLIGPELLAVPMIGAVGYHPAALPKNRGRHPIIWALALGLEETASTFFFLDEGADSGDILSQKPVPITYGDDAGSLYSLLTRTALSQLAEFVPALVDGSYARTPQDHSLANTWRKRGRADGAIDFRMSSRSVYNLVRALARPYVGAHLDCGGDEARVWRVHEVEVDAPNVEPGKVLAVDGRRFTVKCGEGAVEVVEHELETIPRVGEYV